MQQTILKARFDEKRGGNSAVDTLLLSMCGILFFGVPHRGALVGTMEKLLREEDHYQRLDLLDEIRRGSSVMKRDLDRFVDLAYDFNIYTFYAMNETRDFVRASCPDFALQLQDFI